MDGRRVIGPDARPTGSASKSGYINFAIGAARSCRCRRVDALQTSSHRKAGVFPEKRKTCECAAGGPHGSLGAVWGTRSAGGEAAVAHVEVSAAI